MVRLISENREVSVKLLEREKLRSLLQSTRWSILSELSQKPNYAGNLADKFDMEEQKLHYHFKKLKEHGLIRVVREEQKRGAVARYYEPTSKGYAIVLGDWSPRKSQPSEIPSFLENFYSKGVFDALVIVGSPDPHGPHEARARDNHYIGDLCLFLGSFSSGVQSCVRLDTEVKEKELEEKNLVLVGGPVTNMITARINDDLPVRMKIGERWGVHSDNSKESYYENIGLIVQTESVWGEGKKVLVIAGTSRGGTKAAMLALITKTRRIARAPIHRVVKGLDRDGDGVIDSVKIIE